MKRSIGFLLMLVLPIAVMAQSTYKFSPKSTIKVEGTSTMHDWSMLSSSLTGDAQLEVAAGKLNDVKKLQLSLPAETLKSGKNAMDKNAYEALKIKQNPNIQFKLGSVNQIEQKGNEGTMTVSGLLTIAGVSKQEKIEVKYTIDKDGNLKCLGKKEIKMSTYGVTPPSFMFGSVTTGDAITISFDIQLMPTQQVPQ
jgi:polyisoprenoid-binding protein YceI